MANTPDKYINSSKIVTANNSGISKGQKVDVPKRNDGTVGIRSTLNNMGINNSMIGYDSNSGNVTLGGKNFLTPTYLDDEAGVSYASPTDIQNGLIQYYSGSNNPLVKVSDAYSNYAGQYGLSADALGYDNGNVTIGGEPLDYMFTDDNGKSWAFQNDVLNSVENFVGSQDVSSPNEILDYYNNKYLKPISSLADNIRNRDEFEYDPNNDPVYEAYKNQYLTQGNRASADAMASYAGLTGGYANSAAATATAQTQQYYMTQLTNQIPELAKQAYERYADRYNADIELLDNMIDVYDTAFGNAYSANNKTINNINNTLSSNAQRDSNASEKYWNDLFNKQKYDKSNQDYYWTDTNNTQDYDWKEILNGQSSTKNYLDIEGSRLDNMQQQIYLQYYNKLLQAELEGNSLTNQLTQEKINQLIMQNMVGYY